MCGIFVLIRPNVSYETAKVHFEKGKARGPDASVFQAVNDKVWMGAHRLAIQGLGDDSNQPLRHKNLYVVCSGEIYNHRELYASLGVEPSTSSDCEILLHLYERYGIEQTLHLIDASEFAFVLYDFLADKVFAARDPYGVRPLYRADVDGMVAFSTDQKSLQFPNARWSEILPGTVATMQNEWSTNAYLSGDPCVWSTSRYISLPTLAPQLESNFRNVLYDAIRKRVVMTDRPIACLLSGGLDSSLIAAIVQQIRLELGYSTPLETYSIGLEGAEDLKHASIMADHIQSTHTTIVVSEDVFFHAIPEVVDAIESYDTTTVRASVGNYLVGKYIRNHSEAKVIFNGDGSDEMAGGYLYFHGTTDANEKDAECRRLLTDIYRFDALRSDRCIATNGLEARTPFLDRAVIQAYLSIPIEERFPPNKCEKFLLRTMFQDLLPPSICWRTKEAFSDGVSSLEKPWYSIIQARIPEHVRQEFEDGLWNIPHNPPSTAEQYYYRNLYRYDPKMLPYFWMPRFVDAADCSARTLSIYTS